MHQQTFWQSTVFAEAMRTIDEDGSVVRSRLGDPETSRAGADHIDKKVMKAWERMLLAFEAPRTSEEAATWCKKHWPEDRTKQSSYRKRKRDLQDRGWIECVGRRKCHETGQSAEVFLITRSGSEELRRSR